MDPITRREQFLAAAAAENGEAPDPVTREEYFLKAIADKPDLPAVGENDKDKYLHTNASTGAPEWTSGGGGGGSGALVVTCTYSDKIITADKTTKEIYDAYVAGTVVLFANANAFGDTTYDSVLGAIDLGDGSYRMTVSADFLYFSGSANEYPICDTSDD